MLVQPYLFFGGRADEAIEFYKKTVGAKPKMLMRFKDAPDQSMVAPGSAEKVMHAAVDIGDSTVLISDGRCTGATEFKGFSLVVSAPSEAEADKVFGALSDGGQVDMPLAKAFFAKRFGMLTDKFGVGWMVIVPQEM
ncbi:MAG TPA: VOC family protein [Xanthobacteraceae bacterium]|nr:VOC family protein [Xanthobacteraceae bacterium]